MIDGAWERKCWTNLLEGFDGSTNEDEILSNKYCFDNKTVGRKYYMEMDDDEWKRRENSLEFPNSRTCRPPRRQ